MWVAMATRLCLTDASCKSVWKREGPFVFGRVEWASLNPRCGKKKRALECVWAGDRTALWAQQNQFPLPRGGQELGGLQGAALNS